MNTQCSLDRVGTAFVENAVLVITDTQSTPLSFYSKRVRKQVATSSLSFHLIISSAAALLFKGGSFSYPKTFQMECLTFCNDAPR